MRIWALTGPGGTAGYRDWLAAQSATWAAASTKERTDSRNAAWERHEKLNQATPKAEGDATVLLVYDEIGFWGISADELVSQIRGIQGDLELHLNTPGGSVFDGIAIANALKQRTGQVQVIVDGLAASIGSVIAMAASPGQLLMAPNSVMMIHEASGVCLGDAADMLAMGQLLDQMSGNIATIYASRSGTPADAWRDTMKAESWMVGQEAIDAGLADAMTGGDAPEAEASAAADQPWHVEAVATDEPYLGAESMPLLDAAIAVHHTATVDEAWNGPAAVAAMPNDAATLKGCHAWQDGDGDPDTKASYKFPHHKTKGGPANLAACRNGKARLSGASIPDGDRSGVAAHLDGHLADGGGGEDHAHDPVSALDPAELQQALKEAFK